VNEAVPHADNRGPRYVRSKSSRLIRNSRSRLADYLDRMHDREEKHAIRIQIRSSASVHEPFDRL